MVNDNIYGFLCGDEFQEYDVEVVDVILYGGYKSVDIFWCYVVYVVEVVIDSSVNVCVNWVYEMCQVKVGDLGFEFFVKENVIRVDIVVDDVWVVVMVKLCEFL